MRSQKLYQKYAHGRHWEKHPTIYAKRFAAFLKERNFNGLLVDVGCGNGRDVAFFSKFGFNASGIDYSEKEIALAKEKFPTLQFEVRNAENLKFKDNSVGAFFMINLIHYVNMEKALREVYRTLKSRGYFFTHFNISIIDKEGKVDYSHDLQDILKLVSKFKIICKKTFERVDLQPIEHTHKIIELILQKP
ncbi:class I SAM-dependent methyltransferase [Candidatus Woesearchaeota archaeon]|nr:class I SAM-dependent methyltransferase [Candidatus Woesearchaeota archaeon]